MDRTTEEWQEMGSSERGNDMQERATGGLEPGPPAVGTVASVHGVPTLPIELNDTPLLIEMFLLRHLDFKQDTKTHFCSSTVFLLAHSFSTR